MRIVMGRTANDLQVFDDDGVEIGLGLCICAMDIVIRPNAIPMVKLECELWGGLQIDADCGSVTIEGREFLPKED